jgi:hypothetical protein
MQFLDHLDQASAHELVARVLNTHRCASLPSG